MKIEEIMADALNYTSLDGYSYVGAESVIRTLEHAGYAIVPVEPTKEMLKAGISANVGPRISVHGYIYKAMIKQAKEEMS